VRREISIKQSAELADLIIVHDAGRKLELEYQEKYLKPHFELRDKGGTRCHFWSRRDALKKEDIREAVEEMKKDTIEYANNLSSKKPDSSIFSEALFDHYGFKLNMQTANGKVRLVFSGRGEGGAERSTTWLMKTFDQMGYEVEYVTPKGPSGTFKKADDTGRIKVLDFNKRSIQEEVDLLILYVNDWVWDFDQPRVVEPFEAMKAKRKVMVINFRIGKIGKIPWTLGWDKYIFLNTSLYKSLRELETEAPMKVLPPPTDLTEFLKIKPDYDDAIRIVRHSSQGDVKYSKDFGDKCREVILRIVDSSISLMPAPTFIGNIPGVFKCKRNVPPVPEFLSQGNVFWYWLPEGYEDQGPKVIMEAQAAGLPVVAQDHSGPRDRVKSTGSGFLSNDFEDHIVFLHTLQDPGVRKTMGEMGRSWAEKEYDPHRWIEEVLE